jgi:carbon-monoxide dehydrogenase medium subunit
MQDFDYLEAATEAELIAALSAEEDGVCILSGGTDLLVQLREGRRTARLLVDIKPLAQANALAYDPATGLQLGAAVPCYRICAHPDLARFYPGLLDGISLIGGVQIQGRASVGGNLCNASPAADAIPPLIVHSATCIISGPDGRRTVAAEDFCLGPGRTQLRRGEFLVALTLPPPAPWSGGAYLRFTPRNEMDIAVASAGAWVLLDQTGLSFRAARIALGAVAPVPLFVPEAGRWLVGRPVDDETIAEAARIARAAARPISDLRGTAEQRTHLAGVLTRRALAVAVERARRQQEVAS